jgi:hypothetical protein
MPLRKTRLMIGKIFPFGRSKKEVKGFPRKKTYETHRMKNPISEAEWRQAEAEIAKLKRDDNNKINSNGNPIQKKRAKKRKK